MNTGGRKKKGGEGKGGWNYCCFDAFTVKMMALGVDNLLGGDQGAGEGWGRSWSADRDRLCQSPIIFIFRCYLAVSSVSAL